MVTPNHSLNRTLDVHNSPQHHHMMFKEACHSDAERIADLVNNAYRPETQASGWTHESGLVSGPRIRAEQVRQLIGENGCVLVSYDQDSLVGCVHIERAFPYCCIGMLATLPTWQNKGLGSALLAEAERVAVFRYGAHGFIMQVLSARPELLAYYERRGYQQTGSIAPYPLAAGVGQPIDPNLQVLELLKLVQTETSV